MKARYRYRFYPTDQQRQSLAQLFGCIRVVWNDALNLCKSSEKLPNYNHLSGLLTASKKTQERSWLNNVSCVPLQQSRRHLSVAYKNFFNSRKGKRKGIKVGTPKFKKKTNSQSAEFTKSGFSIKGCQVYLAKVGDVSPISPVGITSEPSSVTVIKDCANRYFLSFVVEINPASPLPKNQSVGIDLGLKTFASLSDGTQVKSPDYSKPDRKIRKLQRKLARQPHDSRRRNKTRIRIARQYNKIADTRADFLHKLSTKIVRENQTVVLEDLNVSGMVKNRRLARAISGQGWYQFRVLCEAKCDKFGRDFRVISRWEPTSQVCSECDFRWGKLDLSVREFVCINCGTHHDRDGNAAKNIEKVGMGYCHDSKRTQRESKTTTVASPNEASRITALLGR
ncbi:transposase [Microcoleus vaginatus GB1-A2]|uniref:RNA-guided endonuclease InsQ/TnpB family protein n=1 Tax=Microcoleus vaginatus TaxID=119532 RepID=UPI001687AC4D|nr:IS200/IS605 family element transposase accessory protein TnpB [Microcoleus sp. FACHB-61]